MKISAQRRLLILLVCLLPIWAAGSELFNDDGYRATRYRSPTPASHEHAVTIGPQELQQLLQDRPDAALIDVYNNPWLHGHFTLQEEHNNLPGSLWLANCGLGTLEEAWRPYCEGWLKQISGGDKNFPLVIYCRSDCWLGWNAARRAASWGYGQLYWLRDGIEGWADAGFELVRSEPLSWPDGVAPPAN